MFNRTVAAQLLVFTLAAVLMVLYGIGGNEAPIELPETKPPALFSAAKETGKTAPATVRNDGADAVVQEETVKTASDDNAPPKVSEAGTSQKIDKDKDDVPKANSITDGIFSRRNIVDIIDPTYRHLISDTRRLSYAGVRANGEPLKDGDPLTAESERTLPCGVPPSGLTHTKTKPSVQQCHHGRADIIGDFLLNAGYWISCIVLPHLAHFAYGYSSVTSADGSPVVVEVGGNVGSCAMLMASRGAHVTAFEPFSGNSNLAHQSIRLSGYHDRVTWIRAGAANVSGATAEITVQKGNAGNSAVLDSKAHTDEHSKAASLRGRIGAVEVINLIRIDDVILGSNPSLQYHIHLLKMDCQGSEFKALQGAKNTLESGSVDIIYSEFDTRLIRAVGSEPRDMLLYLMKLEYTLYYVNKQHQVVLLQVQDVDSFVAMCVDDHHSYDFAAFSKPIMLKAGDKAVRRVLGTSDDALRRRLMSDPPLPQPDVNYPKKGGPTADV